MKIKYVNVQHIIKPAGYFYHNTLYMSARCISFMQDFPGSGYRNSTDRNVSSSLQCLHMTDVLWRFPSLAHLNCKMNFTSESEIELT